MKMPASAPSAPAPPLAPHVSHPSTDARNDSPDSAQAPDAWRQQTLTQARAHLTANRQEEARAACRLVLSQFPNDPEAVGILSHCHFDLNAFFEGSPPPPQPKSARPSTISPPPTPPQPETPILTVPDRNAGHRPLRPHPRSPIAPSLPSLPDPSLRFAEDLLSRLRGRIAIVGNATPTRPLGELIDAYDVVIRMNNFRTEGFEASVGSRTHLRCTTGWHDVEPRGQHSEFSPFTAAARESTNVPAYNQANPHPLLTAALDVHPFIPELPKPSTGLALVQLLELLNIPADLFCFDGFKTPHYWNPQDTYTTHSPREIEILLQRRNVLLFGETYPYRELYDYCHQHHAEYDDNVGLALFRRLPQSPRSQRILEFGAGNGQLAAYLETLGNQVTAVEVSAHAFQRIPVPRKIQGDALSLAFLQDPFDLVVSVDVLEHLTENDIRLFLRQAARLGHHLYLSVSTRPSGLLGPAGQNLHLTVRPTEWWLQEVSPYFDVQVSPGFGDRQIVLQGPNRLPQSQPIELPSVPTPTATPTPPSHQCCLKPGYSARSQPEYFEDSVTESTGIVWQPEVYPAAAALARQLGCTHLLDVGCGHAAKLVALHPEFQIIGLDYGPNLHHCRAHYPFGQWLEIDLESPHSPPLPDDLLSRTVIICSDVIEHLINPSPLLDRLHRWLATAPAALLSTPERDLTRGPSDLGPPANPAHVREWNWTELFLLLRRANLLPVHLTLTPSNNREPDPKTTLAILANPHRLPEVGTACRHLFPPTPASLPICLGWTAPGLNNPLATPPPPPHPQPTPSSPNPRRCPPGLLRHAESPTLLAELTAAAHALDQLDWPQALHHYQQARKLHPTDPVLHEVLDQAIQRLHLLTLPSPTDLAHTFKTRRPCSPNHPVAFSFCIITNGQRPEKLSRLLASIRHLNLPHGQILVGGEPPAGLPDDVLIVPAIDAARHGRLGEMRNRLTERASGDILIIADDDLVFLPGFARALLALEADWDVQCPRFLNPDGSRYWDWATHDGPRGHKLLPYDATDPHVYVTGGLCVMRAEVARQVRWDESLGFYRGEDVEFSARLRQAGFRLRANPQAVVVHHDLRYTQLGDVIVRHADLLQLATNRFLEGRTEEAARLTRRAQLLDPVHTPPPAWRPRQVHTPVRWLGPVFNPSGYASEAINFLVPLGQRLEIGLHHHSTVYSEKFVDGLAPRERQALFKQRDRFAHLKGGIVISHNPAHGFLRPHDAAYAIGRSMFETDRIPRDWVAQCNQMDEVWVPSQFNVETFARTGVLRDKLVVIPGAVDEHEFDPARYTPLPLPNRAAFNFLSIFEWSSRKAWDVLLAAYLREFSAEDDVCLYLRTYLFNKPDGDPSEVIWNLIRDYAQRLNLGAKPWPRIELLAHQVPQADLPRLYLAADCLVGATRGEGWGRPQHEAMMLGLPVIATNWSANTAFMNHENSYLVDYDLVEARHLEPELRTYHGHRWANPSEPHLRATLRQVQQNPAAARAKGALARQHVLQHFSREPIADLVEDRLAEIERRLSTPACPAALARQLPPLTPPARPSTLRVAWTGSYLDHGSLSHVNRALTRRLAEHKDIALTRVSRPDAPPAAPGQENLARQLKSKEPADTQIAVRHGWPPDWTMPAQGAWVLIQPWEYGVLPETWLKNLGAVQEIWAYTEHVRRTYIESGVHPDTVHVVPLGIEPDIFKPEAPPFALATRKQFKFLFVGGTIHRKGPDLLLQAYAKSFTAADDVCLVIKDFGGQSVYQGQTLENQIRALQADPQAPEILHLTAELPADALPGLYTACDCLVHPYRGEGFGLPVLEAMACGLPVIVTGGGATDDFATDEFARRLPATRRAIDRHVGSLQLVRPGWLLEPSLEALAAEMRRAFQHPDEGRALGLRASEHVRHHWTWTHAANVAAARLQHLAARLEEERAATAARRARQSAPLTLPPCARLGQLEQARSLFQKKDLPAAWAATLRALQERPFHPEGVLLLGEIAGAAGDSARPRQLAQRAAQMAPRWKPAQQFLRHLKPSKNPTRTELPPLPAPLQPHATPRLTVCLITKNEERFLDACLRSVAGLASQIVIVDTGSTDRTLEIAREHRAEVHTFPWADDFSAARNAALEHARGDWILMLDADEELPPDQHEQLRRHLQDPTALAFRLPILDTGHEDEGCHHVPRLFRNAPGLFYVGRIHEQVFSSVEVRRRAWGLENRIGTARLLHHGYQKEVVRSRQKTARNLRLLEQAIEEIPNDPNLLMNLGLELVRSGHLDEGLGHYAEAFALLSAQPAHQVVPELRESLLTQFATHLLSARQHGEIVRILTSPLARSAPLTATHHFLLGLAHLELRQLPEAIAQMRECLAKRDRPSLTPAHRDVRKAGPHHCIAMAAHALKQPEAAAQAFVAALRDDPKSRAARLDYARFLHGQRQSVAALQQLHQLVADHPEDAVGWDLGARIALAQPEFLEVASDWTAAACQQLPGNGTLQLLRAEALLLAGDPAGALPLWRTFLAPNNPSHVAALLLAEAATGAPPAPPAPAMAAAVNQAFVKWCQRLAQFGAAPTLQSLLTHLPRWATALPNAAHIFQQAFQETSANQPA